MPHWQELYDYAILRALLLIQGVPADLSDLPEPIKEIAQELLEELGEAAYEGIRGRASRGATDAFTRLLVRIDGHLVGEVVLDDVDGLARLIRFSFAAYSSRMEDLAAGSIDEIVRTVVGAHGDGLGAAAELLGVTVSAGTFDSVPGEWRARAADRRGYAVPPERVIRVNVQAASGAVDRFIRGNVGRPIRETAQELLAQLAGDNEAVREALSDLGARGEAVRRAIVRAGRAQSDLGPEGNRLYHNAQRALQNELANAYHEANALAYALSPAVRAVQWTTSHRHRIPDVCDVLEQADLHGLGPGLYYPQTVPSRPHVFCQCPILPVYRPPEEWGRPKPEPKMPRLLYSQDVERVLAEISGETDPTLTPNRLRTQQETLNRVLQVAHDSYVDY